MAVEEILGQLPSDWAYTTLGIACAQGGGDIQTGPFGSQLHAADYVPSGIPAVMPQNIGDNRIVVDGIAQISPADANRLNRYLLRAGDIVYSRRGDVERRALVRQEQEGWLCGTGCLRIRFGDGVVDPEYASYYLRHSNVRGWIVRHAHGATMANLNTSILSDCPLVLPPWDEQRAIARILGTFDNKIELNRRMSETLEAIARALFKSWFVDFDPVRAKAEGRDPGLPAPIADLFPDRFEDSELGMIPAGWVIGPVGTLAELAIGGDWGRDRPLDGDVEVRCLRGVDIDLLRRTGWSDAPKRYVSRASYEKRRPKPTDVLVEGSGQCGRSLASSEALTGVFLEPIIYSNFCKRLVTPSPDHALYLEYVLNDLVASGEMTNFVTGTAMPNLDHHGLLKGSMIVLPPTPVLVQFGRFAEVVRSRLFSPESRTLAEIRDALLPKLISGELRVPQAERLLEAAPA